MLQREAKNVENCHSLGTLGTRGGLKGSANIPKQLVAEPVKLSLLFVVIYDRNKR